MDSFPVSSEISYEDPAVIFQLFSEKPWAIFLDSANSNRLFEDTNRYSYIVFDPFEKILIKNGKKITNPFQYVKAFMRKFKSLYDPNLPIFQGGAVGYFSYDLCHYYETINKPTKLENLPYADLAIGLYDTVISFDHLLKKAWIVSTGFRAPDEKRQTKQAEMNIQCCLETLSQPRDRAVPAFNLNVTWTSPFNQQAYERLVEKAKDYILQGDIFEVNLSHRFEAQLDQSKLDKYGLYLNLRQNNPSPFSAYLNFNEYQILSMSPERFLSLQEGHVITRPIKGTAPRGKTPIEDQKHATTLSKSEKDRSENIMIVDLLRNDLSKVCTPESVQVTKLCEVETYPTVHHLVSVIEGNLKTEATAFDLLEACFPGGSITGAPKIRAMQIIYTLEPTARGPYCGSIGYIGFNGAMDTSIVIRTLLFDGKNNISYQAGGAIVLDSSPEEEYQETLLKSASIFKSGQTRLNF